MIGFLNEYDLRWQRKIINKIPGHVININKITQKHSDQNLQKFIDSIKVYNNNP